MKSMKNLAIAVFEAECAIHMRETGATAELARARGFKALTRALGTRITEANFHHLHEIHYSRIHAYLRWRKTAKETCWKPGCPEKKPSTEDDTPWQTENMNAPEWAFLEGEPPKRKYAPIKETQTCFGNELVP